MNDMSLVIVAKSNQLNADDLLNGPRTITITRVEINTSSEQPVTVRFDGDNGKPWHPCKTTSRMMVAAWGPDASKYAGRSLTLYRDANVKFGGMLVGGIRISHMTHLSIPDDEEVWKIALQETKGKKKMYLVRPLVMQKARAEQPAAEAKPDPQPEQKRRTWADVLPDIQRDLDACKTEDQVQDVAARPMIKQALSNPESATAQRLNSMIKLALDRFAEPITDDDAPVWTEESAA